jgi:hypothetical protein
LLERWYQQGIEEGGRVRLRLRDGVKAALESLGSGFLRHPANGDLLAKLDEGRLTKGQLYRELLNVIYRFLFLMVAEERRLLVVPDAGAAARHEVYLRWYGIGRLRDRAERRVSEDGYGDLWEGLKETFRVFRDERIAASLALSALNGELFGANACFDLERSSLRNDDLLDAIRQLSTFEERSGRKKTGVHRRVNYAGLDVEELGSIYESLLDYHPQVRHDPPGFALAAGSERRATGSYYTPPELVRELIESALVPVIQDRLSAAPTSEAKEKALLSLTICDPAAGSGHFLLAAARRVGRELAGARSGEAEPAPETYRTALRDVIRHCIYAVDKNPLAVDLCKVALWIEGHAPGLPLSFLDNRVRCGDSLVGVLDLDLLQRGVPDEAYKPLNGDSKSLCSELRKRNKRERGRPLDAFARKEIMGEFARLSAAVAEMPDGTPEEVQRKAARYHALRAAGTQWEWLRRACDFWTTPFFAQKAEGSRFVPTTADVWRALSGHYEQGQFPAFVEDLRDEHGFFHWALEFPEVFERGGFDVILGNPPWETMSPDAKEFFAYYDREVRFLSPEEQEKRFGELKADPCIAAAWDRYCRDLYIQVQFYKESGRYAMFAPGNLGKGDLNVYRMFVETALDGIRPGGYAAQLVPENLYNGANAAGIRTALFEHFQLQRLVGFENSRGIWFPAIDTRAKFCLYVASKGGRSENFSAAFRVASHQRLAELAAGAGLSIPISLVREFSPDALAVMEFGEQAEIDICRKMYERYPKFGEHIHGAPNRVYMREVDMGTNRSLFTDRAEGLPVLEGRTVDPYDYRAKGYRSGRGRAAHWEELQFGHPDKAILPQWRIAREKVPARLGKRISQYRISYCKVGSPTNERTLKAALVPPNTICGDIVPTILFEDGDTYDLFLWLGVANSLAVDFLVRKRVALHLTYTVMDSLPFPRDHRSTPAAEAIIARAYALSVVGPEMAAFRQATAGTPGIPVGIEPAEDPARRALLMAEIDALVAREVYGLSRDELRYVLDPENILGRGCGIETFKALRNREKRELGEYRTQRLVLEAWDRFAEDGTFDPARLEDPTHFGVVRRALVQRTQQVASLELELQALLQRSDTTPLPSLFVEGESDVTILTAAWEAFHPSEPPPVTILGAGGTRQMESLAGKGRALRQVLGDRLVFALADNDREGRDLVEDGRTKRGGTWRQQTNGIHWCLLAPTPAFEQAMKRFGIPEAFWPFTIENAFPTALRRQAMAEGAYAVDEAVVQASFHGDTGIVNKALAAAHQLDRAGDDAVLYFRPPLPDSKLAFAQWIAAPDRRDRATFAAFATVLDELKSITDSRTEIPGGRAGVGKNAFEPGIASKPA